MNPTHVILMLIVGLGSYFLVSSHMHGGSSGHFAGSAAITGVLEDAANLTEAGR